MIRYLIVFIMLTAVGFGVTITSVGAQGAVNWSTDAAWVGGTAPVAANDVIVAAGDTFTIDAGALTAGALEHASIKNAGTGTIVCPLDTVASITADLIQDGTVALMTTSVGGNLAIIGNITNTAIAGSGDSTIIHAVAGMITVTGDVTGGGQTLNHAIYVTHTDGDVVINGDASGGVGVGANAIFGTEPSHEFTVTGTITGGTGSYAYCISYTNAGAGVTDSGIFGTVAYVSGRASPFGYYTPATITITTITINGTEFGGGTTDAHIGTGRDLR